MQNVSEICANCQTDSRCRRRDFSERAWAVLALWNEVQPTAIDQPICDHCYNELREVLIDRADEIAAAAGPGDQNPNSSGKGAASGRSRVRKAG